jgi:hypothetical protein
MRSNDVWMKLKAVPGRCIKKDLNCTPPAFVLREADGSKVLIVPDAIFDAIKDKLMLENGRYVPAV